MYSRVDTWIEDMGNCTLNGKLRPVSAFAGDGAILPNGVRVIALQTHVDPRGDFTELFREEWGLGPRPPQWNLARSAANVLRGVHTHSDHYDYLHVAAGEMVLGLRDSRVASETFGWVAMMRFRADDPHLVVLPPGVSHGFYFPEPSMHIYGVSAYFVRPEAAACRWNDPDLGLDWPCDAPNLSEKDATSGNYAQMLAVLARREGLA